MVNVQRLLSVNRQWRYVIIKNNAEHKADRCSVMFKNIIKLEQKEKDIKIWCPKFF